MAASVWKGHLTFGLVTIPVRLFSAARSETISFNLLHKDDHSRIKQVTYCQAEDKPIHAQRHRQGLRVRKGPLRRHRRRRHQEGRAQDRQGDGDSGVRQGRPGRPHLPRKLLLHGAG